MKFEVEFTTRAVKDLKGFSLQAQGTILEESLVLETAPFPYNKKNQKNSGYKISLLQTSHRFKKRFSKIILRY